MTSSVYKTEKIVQKIVEIEEPEEEISSFFDCSYEYKEIIFLLMKNDNFALLKNDLFIEKQGMFYNHRKRLIHFSSGFNYK